MAAVGVTELIPDFFETKYGVIDGLWILVTLHLPGPTSSLSASDMRATEPGAPLDQSEI